MINIEQYQAEDGGIPFRVWFGKLRVVVAKAAIAKRIDRLALGNFGSCRNVGNGK